VVIYIELWRIRAQVKDIEVLEQLFLHDLGHVLFCIVHDEQYRLSLSISRNDQLLLSN